MSKVSHELIKNGIRIKKGFFASNLPERRCRGERKALDVKVINIFLAEL
jgi:hypothetical protein